MTDSTPSRLSNLAEIGAQVYDRNDPIAVRYRQMLADLLDPERDTLDSTARENRENTKKVLHLKVITPTRLALQAVFNSD